jgi:hypothetical protein
MTQLITFFTGMLLLAQLTGCSKSVNKPNDENEHESINRVALVFSEPGTASRTFIVEDPDGDGGNPPNKIDTIFGSIGKTYTVVVKLFSITNGVTKEVTSTVQTQAASHEFYFIPSDVPAVIQKIDKDKNGYPIGFQSTWQFSAVGTGSLLLKLMHKTALKGPNDGPNVGHSDLQVQLPLVVR